MNPYGQSAGGSGGSGYGGDRRMVANGMPNIRISQIPSSFIKQLPWMVPALLVMTVASWWFTKDIKREYMADGSIFVQPGREHVYDPVSGNTNAGINITADQITLTEASIIKNPSTVNTVIHKMIASEEEGGVGGKVFAPKLYAKWVEASPTDRPDRWNDIVKSVNKSFVVMPKAKSSIIDLVYKHENGTVAVQTLDAFLAAYQDIRKDIFVSEATGQIEEQLTLAQEQLAVVDKKIQRILNRNDISEFTSEQTGVQKRSETLRTEMNTLRGNIAGVEAALAATEDQLRQTPETIDLQVDDRASQRLAQANLERRQLLAKYLPSSMVVRNKEAEITEIQSQIRANGGKPAGGRRVGPNTVYQALMTQRNTYQAQADSYREREIILQAQLNAAVGKVKHMRELGPVYQNLLREKTTLEERVKGLNAKEQAALAAKQQQDAQMANVKIISPPITPRKGRNMRKVMFALGVLASMFTVFMLALLRVFTDPNLYGPGTGTRNRAGLAPVAAPDYNQGYDANYGQEYAPDYGYAQPAPIPEAVPGYGEPYPQQPEYAPAATQYAPQHYEAPQEPQAYEPQAYEAPLHTGYEQAVQPQPQEMPQMAPQTPQAYAPQAYAEANTASANPYLNTSGQAAVPAQQYAGVDATLPVLGHVEYAQVPNAPGVPGTYVG